MFCPLPNAANRAVVGRNNGQNYNCRDSDPRQSPSYCRIAINQPIHQAQATSPLMTVSEKNRKLFEGVGLEFIRRELTVGNNYYIPIDPPTQAEAREWVAEQEKEIREAERDRTTREKLTLKYTRWTLFAAIAAVFVGLAGIIMSLMLAGSD